MATTGSAKPSSATGSISTPDSTITADGSSGISDALDKPAGASGRESPLCGTSNSTSAGKLLISDSLSYNLLNY